MYLGPGVTKCLVIPLHGCIVLFLQELRDIYLFGIVGALVWIDIIILIPPTAVSSAILRREQEEIEGEDVSKVLLS